MRLARDLGRHLACLEAVRHVKCRGRHAAHPLRHRLDRLHGGVRGAPPRRTREHAPFCRHRASLFLPAAARPAVSLAQFIANTIESDADLDSLDAKGKVFKDEIEKHPEKFERYVCPKLYRAVADEEIPDGPPGPHSLSLGLGQAVSSGGELGGGGGGGGGGDSEGAIGAADISVVVDKM